MVDINTLTRANTDRWVKATVTRNLTAIAKALIAAKPRYQAVEKATGVPWWVIAVIHERESSQNWHGSLAQGDPWDRVSIHVPAGRGPFNSWEEAAIDALVNCGPFLARKKDWSLGAALTNLELYNGTGYVVRGLPSPYLWAGTDQYRAGKYVADGKFDPAKVDPQPGCAALLKTMMALGGLPEIPDQRSPYPFPKPKPVTPSVTNPAPGSIGAFIASIFNAIFRRK
ncbi:lysozyme family protein [Bradyrhizobium diazoefficiens]